MFRSGQIIGTFYNNFARTCLFPVLKRKCLDNTFSVAFSFIARVNHIWKLFQHIFRHRKISIFFFFRLDFKIFVCRFDTCCFTRANFQFVFFVFLMFSGFEDGVEMCYFQTILFSKLTVFSCIFAIIYIYAVKIKFLRSWSQMISCSDDNLWNIFIVQLFVCFEKKLFFNFAQKQLYFRARQIILTCTTISEFVYSFGEQLSFLRYNINEIIFEKFRRLCQMISYDAHDYNLWNIFLVQWIACFETKLCC